MPQPHLPQESAKSIHVVRPAAFPLREIDASASGNGRSAGGPCASVVHNFISRPTSLLLSSSSSLRTCQRDFSPTPSSFALCYHSNTNQRCRRFSSLPDSVSFTPWKSQRAYRSEPARLQAISRRYVHPPRSCPDASSSPQHAALAGSGKPVSGCSNHAIRPSYAMVGLPPIGVPRACLH